MSGLLRNSSRLFAGCSELTYIGVSPDQKTLSRSQLAAAMPAEVVGACRTRSIWKNFRFRCGGRRAVMRTAAKRIELPEISGAPITTPVYMDSIRSGERCLALMKFELAVLVRAPPAPFSAGAPWHHPFPECGGEPFRTSTGETCVTNAARRRRRSSLGTCQTERHDAT
jgi:hypothetical protein